MNVMNELVKKDLLDIAKVNVPTWSIVVWMQNQLPDVNSVVQETGTSLLIVATLVYTLFKFYRAVMHFKWKKEDRQDE